jgi:hypothetical protein
MSRYKETHEDSEWMRYFCARKFGFKEIYLVKKWHVAVIL